MKKKISGWVALTSGAALAISTQASFARVGMGVAPGVSAARIISPAINSPPAGAGAFPNLTTPGGVSGFGFAPPGSTFSTTFTPITTPSGMGFAATPGTFAGGQQQFVTVPTPGGLGFATVPANTAINAVATVASPNGTGVTTVPLVGTSTNAFAPFGATGFGGSLPFGNNTNTFANSSGGAGAFNGINGINSVTPFNNPFFTAFGPFGGGFGFGGGGGYVGGYPSYYPQVTPGLGGTAIPTYANGPMQVTPTLPYTVPTVLGTQQIYTNGIPSTTVEPIIEEYHWPTSTGVAYCPPQRGFARASCPPQKGFARVFPRATCKKHVVRHKAKPVNKTLK